MSDEIKEKKLEPVEYFNLTEDQQSLLERIEESRKRIVDMNAEDRKFDPDIPTLDPGYILRSLKDSRDAIQESTKLLSKFAALIIAVHNQIDTANLKTEELLNEVDKRIKKNKF